MMKNFVNHVFSKNFLFGKDRFQKDWPEKELSVTIVIPAWNEESCIENTILSCLHQIYPCKIIVVDDCSTDRTAEIARQYEDRGVKVISLTNKAGSKSRALNCAIPYIDTDIFLNVDADTLLEPESVGRLVSAFDDEKVIMACGYVNSFERKNWWQGSRNAEYMTGQRIAKSAQSNLNIVLVMSGCFTAIRTWFIKENPYDERTMAEDMDLTWTAIERGWNVAYVQRAICHVHDPHNWYTYKNQVIRWFRGYFQNIAVRKWKLCPRLAIVVYPYIVVNLIGMPLSILGLFVISYNPVALAMFMMWMAIMYLYVLITARPNPFTFFIDMARFTVMAYVNYFLYIYSGFKELVMKDKLDVWVKGH